MTWNSPFNITNKATGIQYGHYNIAVQSGLVTSTGVLANSPVFSLLWAPPAQTDPSGTSYPQCLITSLVVTGATVTAFGSPLELTWNAFIARSFTVADSGGTAFTPFTTTKQNYQKARTIMGPSLMADMRIATTGPLTAGVRTLDANPFASSGSYLSTATALPPLVYNAKTSNGQHPICLSLNEGIVIQSGVVFTATGTVRLTVALSYAEVFSY
jgi:hypothetical protein